MVLHMHSRMFSFGVGARMFGVVSRSEGVGQVTAGTGGEWNDVGEGGHANHTTHSKVK